MRRYLPTLALPFLMALVACSSDTPDPPATDTPTAQAPAGQSAQTVPSTPAEADLAPLFGSWGYDAPACSSPILISASSFEGAENSCEISSFVDNGDGSFTAGMSCSSQGDRIEERIAMTPIFGPLGEGIRLDYLDRGGDPVTVFRCRSSDG